MSRRSALPPLLTLAACSGGSATLAHSGETGETGAAETADSGVQDSAQDDSAADTGTPPAILAINELMASNTDSYSPDGASWPDWIELYNPGDSDVDLLGWGIADDHDRPDRELFTSSLVVPALGFALLLADGDGNAGADHLDFQLDADGEEVALYDPDGRRVDWVVFGAQLDDVSAARAVDGSDVDGWIYVLHGTPGASNEAP